MLVRARAREIDRLESEIGDHPRGERVWGAGQQDAAIAGKHFPQRLNVSRRHWVCPSFAPKAGVRLSALLSTRRSIAPAGLTNNAIV